MKITEYGLEKGDLSPLTLVKEREFDYEASCISSPRAVFSLFNEKYHLGKKAEESMYVLGMNIKGTACSVFKVSQGTFACSPANRAGVFSRILLSGACQLIVIHNHPSGDVSPSKEDLLAAKLFGMAASLLELVLADFIILSDHSYFSFHEEKRMSSFSMNEAETYFPASAEKGACV